MTVGSSSVPVVVPRTEHAVKRSLDLILAIFGLFVLAPLLTLIAIAICVESHGGVLYRQARRGRHGEVFSIAKFRTMEAGADELRSEVAHLNDAEWPLFKIKSRDPRTTRIGRVLRAWSLDELPQLWNVVKGEMSLVGPRPLVVSEADALSGSARARTDVRPGVTGLWQVRGRHDLTIAEMIQFDCEYVANWSLASDVAILLRTIGAVAMRRGAY